MAEDARLGRRGEALRRAVLDATLGVVAESGADEATVQRIARRAGVHETSIYRRWRTREALLLDALIDHSRTEIPPPDTGSLRGDLIALLTAVAGFVSSAQGRALLRAGAQASPEYDDALQAFWRSRRDALADVIDAATRRGELSVDTDPTLMVETLAAPLHFRALVSRQPIEPDLPGRLVDLVLKGARA
ncbi:TetR/AcrR family transcriptional regulator [Tsukamurella sp. 8F]|uniref:TetR/AcrR family transcriptional regulator n=1 Tax=unclassified Tsukamurella TaxID=2633480 RepID=UPI0023B91D62|nr:MULTISPECIES: TetR/AcrR family transcriptional regulator [unclassified Tsukamurella]MDF0530582.1 TetR/AcrR family transcriptional regulator [Tsukamurella sp. 8J]MDF0586768.1 TetR/AcrR family transcriptional regulator [Tsukamurella sp. 8F]